MCQSVGLNPLTKPFEYITLNGKMVLYARKDATDQLRDTRKVSITRLERERIDGVYVVTAYAQALDGRTDSSMGAVNIEGLKGDSLANALMKAETKAKRRVTLSICGLGMLDETETELSTIPDARPARVNVETGEIVEGSARPAPQPSNGKTQTSAGPQQPPDNERKQLPFDPTPRAAKVWAMETAPQVWPVDSRGMIVTDVVDRSFAKLQAEGLRGEELAWAWVAKIAEKLDTWQRSQAVRITDAELDGVPQPEGADEAPQF